MKTTIKNQITDYLQWSTAEYEARVFQSILNWCELHGKQASIIQQLLANAEINKWFLQEYAKCEEQFLKINETLPNNVNQMREHYKVCTSLIMGLYPVALMEEIKTNKQFTSAFFMNQTIRFYAN